MLLNRPRFPVETLSATSLTKFATCPEGWRLRYLERIKDPSNTAQFVGLVDHKVWEWYFGFRLSERGEDPGLEWLKGKFRAEWEILQKKENPLLEGDVGKLQEQSLKMIETYYPTALTVQPVAVEQRFEETIPGVPVQVVGYVDCEEQLQLLERKTSKTRMSKPKSLWRFQGSLYQLVFDKPVEWHVITKQKTPQVCTAQTDPNLYLPPSDPDRTVGLVQRLAATIEDYYARWPDGPWPSTCLFGDWQADYCNCRLWRTELKETVFDEAADRQLGHQAAQGRRVPGLQGCE